MVFFFFRLVGLDGWEFDSFVQLQLAEDFVLNSEESNFPGNCWSRRMAVAQHFSLSALKNAQATSHLLSLSKLQFIVLL